MSSFKEVIVVEGYHDMSRLKQVFDDVDVIVTNGSEISQDTLKELKKLNETRGLILFLDPDYPGQRIRRIINDYVGDTKHAFLKKEKCISKNKKKVGIEHASLEDIKQSLSELKTMKENKGSLVYNDLFSLGLIGKKDSKKKRVILTERTGIGFSNGKTLVKKLNMFGYNIEQIKELLGSEMNE